MGIIGVSYSTYYTPHVRKQKPLLTQYGRLTVLNDNAGPVGQDRQALCLCSCGTTKLIRAKSLGAPTQSCGCLQREKATETLARIRDRPSMREGLCKNCTTPYMHIKKGQMALFCSRNCHDRWTYAHNKDWFINRRLKTAGTTLAEFRAVCAAQEHVCAICKRNSRLVADHDHKTGRFRGALCNQCNTALGLLGDNTVALQAAVAYLTSERPQAHARPAESKSAT